MFPKDQAKNLQPALDPVVSKQAKPADVARGGKVKKVKKKKKELGSSRGIETMFRSAYRAQLDLTALAATKIHSVAGLLPSGALGDALRSALLDGAWPWPQWAVLAAWGTVAGVAAARWFRWSG